MIQLCEIKQPPLISSITWWYHTVPRYHMVDEYGRYHTAVSYGGIIRWYHTVVSYGGIMRWYHTVGIIKLRATVGPSLGAPGAPWGAKFCRPPNCQLEL